MAAQLSHNSAKIKSHRSRLLGPLLHKLFATKNGVVVLLCLLLVVVSTVAYAARRFSNLDVSVTTDQISDDATPSLSEQTVSETNPSSSQVPASTDKKSTSPAVSQGNPKTTSGGNETATNNGGTSPGDSTSTPPPTTSGCPAFPAFPNANCTGTLAGVSRSESGTIFTSSDGQVIQNLNITGEVRVNHNNVTIRNVRIRSQGGQAIYILNKTNLLVEDCELDGQGANAEPAIAFHNYTMRRCEITNYGEGPRINGNVTLEDNYIHSFANYVSQGAHQDCIQATSGVNVVIRHNTCIIEPDGANGAIFFSTSNGSNILIEKNLVGGGNWAIQVDPNLYTNVSILNNHITTTVPLHPQGGYFGPISAGPSMTVSGNVWHDGPNAGQTVPQ